MWYMPEDVWNRDGLRAFHIAAKFGANEVPDVFISCKLVDINVVDRQGHSALHPACLTRKAGIVASLVLTGIDTALVDTDGHTALELLLTGKQMECSDKQRRETMEVVKDPYTQEWQPGTK